MFKKELDTYRETFYTGIDYSDALKHHVEKVMLKYSVEMHKKACLYVIFFMTENKHHEIYVCSSIGLVVMVVVMVIVMVVLLVMM